MLEELKKIIENRLEEIKGELHKANKGHELTDLDDFIWLCGGKAALGSVLTEIARLRDTTTTTTKNKTSIDSQGNTSSPKRPKAPPKQKPSIC